jgi:hypothetical protein
MGRLTTVATGPSAIGTAQRLQPGTRQYRSDSEAANIGHKLTLIARCKVFPADRKRGQPAFALSTMV